MHKYRCDLFSWFRPAWWGGITLVIGCLSGCAGSQGFQFTEEQGTTSSLAPPAASSGVQNVQEYHNSLAEAMEQQDASSLERATAAIKNAGSSLKDSLTIKPKVVSAKDPLALSNSPQQVNPDVYFSLAGVYESQGKLEQSVAQFKKGLDVNPENVAGWIRFGRMYDRHGDFRQATMAYQRALEISPDHPTALNDLALCYARQDQYDNALRTMEKAIAANPRKDLYRNNMAMILVAADRPDQALQQLQAVHPPAVAHYNLAVLLVKQQRPEMATRHLQDALQIDPNLSGARDLLASIAGPGSYGLAERSATPRPATANSWRSQPRAAAPWQPTTWQGSSGQALTGQPASSFRAASTAQPGYEYASPGNSTPDFPSLDVQIPNPAAAAEPQWPSTPIDYGGSEPFNPNVLPPGVPTFPQ